MSEEPEDTLAPDLISDSDDTAVSSVSLSLGENSVRLREKSKTVNEETEVKAQSQDKNEDKKKWWLKRPETRLEAPTSARHSAVPTETKNTQTPEVTSSMKEFLEKEELCRIQHKQSVDIIKDKDDTLCDILASAAFDKYPSDFENATDEDIGSFLEEMSKIAGALSPRSTQERTKSGENSSKNPTEEEKSVEELLEEAEKLVRENAGLSKSSSRSDTLVLDEVDPDVDSSRIMRLEKDIFQLIEQEVHKESEKIRKSPKNEKKSKELSYEVIYENTNSLKPPTSFINLESQRKRFEEDKAEVSSSSDLDDPIDRHSKSEEPQKVDESIKDKENLQKEITDVDKDFFDNLLKRSKEKMEGGMSGSSSFGQEDFSHFLRILQGQDRKEQETKDKELGLVSQAIPNDVVEPTKDSNIVYPEKEITEILEKEMPRETRNENKDGHEFGESDSSLASNEQISRNRKKTVTNVSDNRSQSASIKPSEKKIEKSKTEESKKSANSKNELYAVDLTPRLELFADAIPKLLAEKTTETLRRDEVESKKETKDEESRDDLGSNETITKIKSTNVITDKIVEVEKHSRVLVSKESSNLRLKESPKRKGSEISQLGSSKSFDQLSKPVVNLRSSLDDVRVSKTSESSRRGSQQSGKSVAASRYSKPPSRQGTSSRAVPRTKLPLKPSTAKLELSSKSTTKLDNVRYSQAGGDSRKNLTRDDLEALYREEKHKNILLKEQIESESKMYKQQMQNMRTSFEEEMFALKKQNIILKAKVDEFTVNEKRSGIPTKITSKADTRVQLLERELEKQEGIINAYETENKRLVSEMERLQEEMKNARTKQRGMVEANETQKLNETIKDLREDALRLNLEITDLRGKNSDAALKIDDLVQQNSLLKEELEMFKEQLRTKSDYINARLQSMTTAELESRKKTDDMRVELRSKTAQLEHLKNEYERLERAIAPLEKELLELRTKEANFTEKMQVARSHVEREKQLTLKLKDQVILDNKKILDLNRQVREMERILKRKNPDSVSALILTAKSDHERVNLEKVKLLEDRIASLEGEIEAKEQIGQEKLGDLQKKFGEMREKYASQVAELEDKLREATSRERKIFHEFGTQTSVKSVESRAVEAIPRREERSGSLPMEKDDKRDLKNTKVPPKAQNSKEDAHLLATIRGLKMELANKDKTFAKINKEFQELQKTNRRLQKERERLLNDRKSFKDEKIGRSASVCSDLRGQTGRSETNDLNSNLYQNGHLSNGNSHRLSGSVPRLYDPLQYSENDDRTSVKKLANENEILKEELSKINKDFMTLKNKRLHDLNLLQEEHEREMAALVKEYSLKFGDSKVVKLQGQINTQVAIITHLKQQIEKLRDYKEQVLVLKVEREHLENKVKILNEKVKYLSTPGTEQLQLLQDKITILQQRHESREMTLQNLVRDLLRNKTQCRDCKGEKSTNNKQLCYFRQELDHILGMLQEISSVQ